MPSPNVVAQLTEEQIDKEMTILDEFVYDKEDKIYDEMSAEEKMFLEPKFIDKLEDVIIKEFSRQLSDQRFRNYINTMSADGRQITILTQHMSCLITNRLSQYKNIEYEENPNDEEQPDEEEQHAGEDQSDEEGQTDDEEQSDEEGQTDNEDQSDEEGQTDDEEQSDDEDEFYEEYKKYIYEKEEKMYRQLTSYQREYLNRTFIDKLDNIISEEFDEQYNERYDIDENIEPLLRLLDNRFSRLNRNKYNQYKLQMNGQFNPDSTNTPNPAEAPTEITTDIPTPDDTSLHEQEAQQKL